MKTPLCITILLILCLGCNEEEKTSESGFIILNRYENKANIASFNYPSKSVSEQYFTVATSTFLSGAAKNGNNVYLNTTYPGKFRKIDLEDQTQITEVDSWSDNFPFINFNNSDIVVSHPGSENHAVIKVYDQNLVLQDSIAIPDVMDIYDAVASNNKLFFSATIVDEGTFIKVMDLSSLNITSSIEIESNSCLLLQLDETNILVIERNQYYILNATTLEISNMVTSTIGDHVSRGNFDFNKSENTIYYLREVAQPSPIPYVLERMNLATGDQVTLTDLSILLEGPMIYDNNNKVIVCGGDAGLQILSLNGQLKHQTELPVEYLFKK